MGHFGDMKKLAKIKKINRNCMIELNLSGRLSKIVKIVRWPNNLGT
jgi:hypothetical protein